MKAAVVTKFGAPLEVGDVPMPEVGPGQVLVKVAACGVCHTDLHAAHGDWPVKPNPPFIPGHEGVGEVVELGREVRGVRVGDRVGVPWLHTACSCCRYCQTGWETLCGQQQMTGYTVNGGFAEYVVADANFVGHLPDGLGYAEAAPILCAGVTVYKGLKEMDCRPGDWVVVSGIGGLGHMAVQYARAMGLRVVAVDIADSKLQLAKQLGAELCLRGDRTETLARIEELGGARGVLVTAVSNQAFSNGVAMLAPGGTMSLVGLPPGDFPLPIFDVVLHRKTIRGSIVGTRRDLAEALDFAARGLVQAHFRSDRLENINQIFDEMQKNAIDGRVVLSFP
ncbi:zinc-dependent alcohol dehydrogenase [bacterium SCN 62-11]|nr:alcohol dehydrogenase AdhP [Candidatus Eremiobacteraeota bacterium]ODT74962.1 MAG: zinc-dependent alcohol dehydrogenase [bacterium SCN 62-11]